MHTARMLLLALTLCVSAPFSKAQESPMSASTGLAPGDSFSLFVFFQNPMPKVTQIRCAFQLKGAPKPGQEDFPKQLGCAAALTRDSDTNYRVKVEIPKGTAAGDYQVTWIVVTMDGVEHTYSETQLPALTPVAISNPEHLEFSPIKKLETKP